MVKSHWDAVEEGAANAGRTPDRSIWRIAREIYVADTTEQARKEALEGTMGRDFQDYWLKLMPQNKSLDRVKLDPNMADADVTPEYLMDTLWIVGSPDDVATQVRELYDEVGGFGVLLAMGHEWIPKDKWVKSLTLLANEVLPQLSDLN